MIAATSVTIDNRSAERWDRAAERFETEVINGLDFVAREATAQLVATSAFNNRSGALRASFEPYATLMLGSRQPERVIGTRVPYAKFLEYGTKSARGRAAAEFIASGFRASRSVRRAANSWRIAPRHFVADARKLIEQVLPKVMKQALKEATRA